MATKNLFIDRSLFETTTHSPSLVDLVGQDRIDEYIDFCFIANPYYPTKEMTKRLIEKLPSIIKYYPSSNPRIAIENLASVIHVNPDQLILGNGATELITIIEREIINDALAIPVPTFGEYISKLRSATVGRYFYLQEEKGYQLNLEEYARWIDKHNINSALIINPGNPTGQLIGIETVRKFLDRMHHLHVVILDESFIDFANHEIPSLLPFIDDYKNLIIVRSMSKHCGVPGLRLGYCCSSNEAFLDKIRTSLPVWNINSIAEFILMQLKETDEIYHITRKEVIDDVRVLFQELSHFDGLRVYPTGSNFILLKVEFGMTARELQFLLLDNYQLYVRDCSNKVGIDQYHIRVASQGLEKDKKLVEVLREVSKL
jgi:histidinol-phosphate/aromatic aminotransferase/cobyric acid decarboxylase-like protein